jgi:hypothetical protein
MHSHLRPLRQGLVHVGLITWEGCHTPLSCFSSSSGTSGRLLRCPISLPPTASPRRNYKCGPNPPWLLSSASSNYHREGELKSSIHKSEGERVTGFDSVASSPSHPRIHAWESRRASGIEWVTLLQWIAAGNLRIRRCGASFSACAPCAVAKGVRAPIVGRCNTPSNP